LTLSAAMGTGKHPEHANEKLVAQISRLTHWVSRAVFQEQGDSEGRKGR